MKDFWLREIGKYTSCDGNILTLRTESDGRIELNALAIKFSDGETCVLIGAEQTDAEVKYNFKEGRCLQAILDGDVLRWQEEYFDTFSPRDPKTGKSDFEQEFTGYKVVDVVRRLDDVIGLKTYALYEMNFDVFDDDEER